MECLIHSLAFNGVKMAWVTGVGEADDPAAREEPEARLRRRVLQEHDNSSRGSSQLVDSV